MQLESQIGVATSYISSRDANNQHATGTITTDQISSVKDSLNLLQLKIASLSDQSASRAPSVNVYNNCHPHRPEVSSKASQTTRDSDSPVSVTPCMITTNEEDIEVMLSCTLCNKSLGSSIDLDNHLESEHGQIPHVSSKHGHPCDYCADQLATKEHLQEHISMHHSTEYIQCSKCIFRAQSGHQLKDHVKTCHESTRSTSQPSTLSSRESPASSTQSATASHSRSSSEDTSRSENL